MRLWYVRRGVPWTPLLACCGLALLVAALGRHWPAALWILQPAALACCAAGAGFVFDEGATAVVSVTPRGAGWRRTARLGVVVVPLAVWLVVLATLSAADTDRPGWATAGGACLLLAAGGAGLCARRGVSAPGGLVAAVVAGLVMMPLVVGPLAGWDPVLPQGPFPDWLRGLWSGAAGLGALLAAWALRPGLR